MLSSKKELAKILSGLEDFKEVNSKLEQYRTESEIAAETLWWMYMNKEIEEKIIADLGCGNGVLGLGCLLLGAKKVYFIDKDKLALESAKENYKELFPKSLMRGKFFCRDVSKFNKKVEVIIENPPFGVQVKNADRDFLDAGMKISDMIFSFHKIESEAFLEKYCSGFKVKRIFEFNFILRKTMKFHKKERHFVRVGLFKIERFKS